ncbi:MAG: peptidylprolyl isomerase [Acidobacteriota bacterium]
MNLRKGLFLGLILAPAMVAYSADKPAKEMSPLKNPKSEELNRTAPDQFLAKFETTKGDFTIEVHRDWAPLGADRFYNLVNNGFYDEIRFFRIISGFMAQFGIHGDPAVSGAWKGAKIKDDPVKKSNTRGFITYAMAGPNTRTTQVFISFGDNSSLDRQGFSPFGKVVEGMEVVDKLYSGYGEGAPSGKGPSQELLQGKGNEYLKSDFPKLDYVKKATILESSAAKGN